MCYIVRSIVYEVRGVFGMVLAGPPAIEGLLEDPDLVFTVRTGFRLPFWCTGLGNTLCLRKIQIQM